MLKRSKRPGPPSFPIDPAAFQWDFETKSGVKNSDKATLLEVMDKLGAEEWELVSVTDNGKFYFKRPKP